MASKFCFVGFLVILVTLDHVTCQALNSTTPPRTLTASQLQLRRSFIKSMATEAWSAYHLFLSNQNNQNTLQPQLSFEIPNSGQTALQSLSTLWLMNLTGPYAQARTWVQENLENQTTHFGPLLSAYALTKDQLFLDQAKRIADRLFIEYNRTGFGIAESDFQLASVEFQYLAQLTGNYRKYWTPIERNYENVFKNSNSGNGINFVGFRRMLVELQKFLQSNSSNWTTLTYFNSTLASMNTTGSIAKFPVSPYPIYIPDHHNQSMMHQVDCTYGTIFALASRTFSGRRYPSVPKPEELLELGKEITRTCFLAANTTNEYRLPPLYMYFDAKSPSMTSGSSMTSGGGYLLSSYLASSYFTLYRVTGDEQYRNYAWALAQAIHRSCKAPGRRGYSGLDDLQNPKPELSYSQPAEFLGSTLKYLYLTFEKPEVLPIEKWVFTLQGQPIPVKDVN